MIAFVIAWFLPEPNVHVDGYVPLIYAAFIDPEIGSRLWWEVVGAALTVYTAVVFAVLSFISMAITARITKP